MSVGDGAATLARVKRAAARARAIAFRCCHDDL
jgi:hypothetical protein